MTPQQRFREWHRAVRTAIRQGSPTPSFFDESASAARWPHIGVRLVNGLEICRWVPMPHVQIGPGFMALRYAACAGRAIIRGDHPGVSRQQLVDDFCRFMIAASVAAKPVLP